MLALLQLSHRLASVSMVHDTCRSSSTAPILTLLHSSTADAILRRSSSVCCGPDSLCPCLLSSLCQVIRWQVAGLPSLPQRPVS